MSRSCLEIETNLQMHIYENLSWGMTPDSRRIAPIRVWLRCATAEIYRDRLVFLFLKTLLDVFAGRCVRVAASEYEDKLNTVREK